MAITCPSSYYRWGREARGEVRYIPISLRWMMSVSWFWFSSVDGGDQSARLAAVQASARTFCNNLASSEVFFELSYYFSLVRIIARIILRDGEHEISNKNRDLLMNEAFYWELGISKTSKYVNIFISPLILLTNISLTPLEMRKLISDQPITSTHHLALLYWGTETGETHAITSAQHLPNQSSF